MNREEQENGGGEGSLLNILFFLGLQFGIFVLGESQLGVMVGW